MKTRTTFSVFAALALAASVLGSSGRAAAQSTVWNEFLGNHWHTSYSTDTKISTANAPQLGVKWMANLYSADLGSPVSAYNTAVRKLFVYVADRRGDVFAIDGSSGQIIWSENLGYNSEIDATPMIASDGTVWVATSNNPTLYKLDGTTGAVDCSVQSPLPIEASPMDGTPNGGVETIYWTTVGSTSASGPTFATHESDCSQAFSFSTYLSQSGSFTTPAFGRTVNGRSLLLVGTSAPDTTEYALDANTGALVWDYPAFNPGGFDIGDGATISNPGGNGINDGAVYFNTLAGYEYALDMTTGAKLWQFQISSGVSSSSRSSAALDGSNLVFGYGADSGFGGSGGVYALNAVNGAQLWQYADATEVLSSPAIIGPSGSEVVAFGDLSGAFRVLSLAGGSQLYSSKTGGYIAASPAEENGEIFITSTDGFLYAFGPSGGNAGAPTSTVSSPANLATISNPNGSIKLFGSASDKVGVNAVEVAIQENGASGPWFNAANGTYNSAPIRNPATLSTQGGTFTKWSLSFPVPPSGGTYTVFASAVNTNNIVNRSAISRFTVRPGTGEPGVTLSTTSVPPGSSFTASATGFAPSEKVSFTLFGATVATVTASSTGKVAKTRVTVPVTAAFGPTALTLTGQTSGKISSAALAVVNNWTQFGHDPSHTAAETKDPTIANSFALGNGTVLAQSWYHRAGAAVNSSPSVVNGVAYFGNDKGVVSAVAADNGAARWTYKTASGSAIHTAPAIDTSGNVFVTSSDGNLYEIGSTGSLVKSVTLGGNLTSPAVDNEQVYVASDAGHLYDVAGKTGAKKWTATLSGAGHSAPAYDPAAKVVVAGDNSGAVTAFNAGTGAQLWKASTGGAVTASPLIVSGAVYVGSADGNLYSLNETTGAVNWKFALTGPIVASASLYGSNQISIGDSKGVAFLLSESGTLVSQIDTKTGSAIVGISNVEGNTLVELANGEIGMIRSTSPPPFAWSFQTGSTLSTSPAIVDGTVYVGAADGGLYAFTPQGSNPLSKTKGPVISITDSGDWMCTTP